MFLGSTWVSYNAYAQNNNTNAIPKDGSTPEQADESSQKGTVLGREAVLSRESVQGRETVQTRQEVQPRESVERP